MGGTIHAELEPLMGMFLIHAYCELYGTVQLVRLHNNANSYDNIFFIPTIVWAISKIV